MTRRLVVLPVLLVIAVLAAGCEAAIEDHDVEQATGGPVRLVTELCAGLDQAPPAGTLETCRPPSGLIDLNGTLLAAYEVPEGSRPVSSTLALSPTLPAATMSRSQSYEAWLDANDPAGEGREWIAFQSSHLMKFDVDPADELYDTEGRLTTLIDPPANAEQFAHQTVLARRVVTAAQATSPVDCSMQPCPVLKGVSSFDVSSLNATATLKNLAVEAGAPVSAEQGQTAPVPFTARYAGGVASETFALSATSGAGTPSIDAPSIAFDAAGAKPVTVSVPVPVDAPVGPKDVTLTIALPDGVTRTATSRIDVTAKPAPPAPPAPPASPAPPAPPVVQPSVPQPPAVAAVRSGLRKLTLRSNRRSSVLRSGLRFTQDFVLAGRATWELRRTGSAARLAGLTRQVGSTGTQSVTLGLTKAGKRALRRKSLPKLEVRTTFVDALGRRSSVTVPIRLR